MHRFLAFFIACITVTTLAFASSASQTVVPSTTPIEAAAPQPDTIVIVDTIYIVKWLPMPQATSRTDTVLPAPKVKKPRVPSKTKFTWGAELAGHVDMTTNDMSAIGFSAYFGFKRGWIKLLGAGATANIMVNNACRTFPVFATLRTNFMQGPSRLFADLRGGWAINFLEDDKRASGPYGSCGIGINLSTSSKFSSHLIVGYTYIGRRNAKDEPEPINLPDLHLATLRLGISF